MEDTVFGKIIRREIPAEIVYEDDETLAFLDAAPVAPGHTLVIPKKPVRNIFDADDATLAALMRTVRKIAPAIRDAAGAHGLHINSNHEAAAGQVVFHLHFHIIPRIERGTYEFWPHQPYAPGEAAAMAAKLREAING
jgi:histidine triad (HIT) family protein